MKTSILFAALLFAGCTGDNNPVHALHDLHGGGQRLLADLDRDGDGKLSADELRRADGPAAMMADHFAALDLDGDGTLDADELQQHHDDMMAVHADGGAQLFTDLDTDRDGKLSVAELQASPGPGQMIAGHLAFVDTDGDGLVSRDELAAAIAKHAQH
jgi:Ca2+-binding EF-hand superfamily protein